MRKDESTKQEDKYWEGNSSLDEERKLKEKVENPYFSKLKEAQEERMAWNFEDFLVQAGESGKIHPIVNSRSWNVKVWSYIAAAMVLILGGVFYVNNDIRPIEKKGLQKDTQTVALTNKPAIALPDSRVTAVEAQPKQLDKNPAHIVSTKKYPVVGKRKKMFIETEKESTESAVPTEEAYVILNGKPVYSEAEAEEIALASLKIMTDNFQEGKQALEKIKYIKVEL